MILTRIWTIHRKYGMTSNFTISFFDWQWIISWMFSVITAPGHKDTQATFVFRSSKAISTAMRSFWRERTKKKTGWKNETWFLIKQQNSETKTKNNKWIFPRKAIQKIAKIFECIASKLHNLCQFVTIFQPFHSLLFMTKIKFNVLEIFLQTKLKSLFLIPLLLKYI